MNSGVYIIRNSSNGKVYVGSSSDLKRRRSEHFRDLSKGMHFNPYLQASWNKYGKHCFQWIVLVSCNSSELLTKEQRILDNYIENLGWESLYNIQPTVNSNLGKSYSLEARANMSRARIGNKNWAGKHHTVETKAKIAKALLGNNCANKRRIAAASSLEACILRERINSKFFEAKKDLLVGNV